MIASGITYGDDIILKRGHTFLHLQRLPAAYTCFGILQVSVVKRCCCRCQFLISASSSRYRCRRHVQSVVQSWSSGAPIVYAPGPGDNAHCIHTPPNAARCFLQSTFLTQTLSISDSTLFRYLQHRFKSQSHPPNFETMVKAPPQAPVADAPASPPAMQDGAGRKPADQGRDGKGEGQQKSATAAHEITRRDVHTASSINAQRQSTKGRGKEPAHAYPTAFSRTKSKEVPKNTPPESRATTSSKPVLVRGPSSKPDMKKKRQPVDKSASPQLPPVENFSFHDILSSIGPDANASIEAIAEICGRSKMSLAAEHNSHRPPHGQLATRGSSPDTAFSPSRLEPVAEASSHRPHTRSMSRSMALATGPAHPGNELLGQPTAATSSVNSHIHTSVSGLGKRESTSSSAAASLLPQVIAWLRGSSSATTNEQSNASGHDAGAINAMHRLLNDSSEARL